MLRITEFHWLCNHSPTERESSSTLAANSQQHLFPSPRIFSGSPQVLGQIEVGRLGMTSTNCLVPSPGPSVANLDDLSLESHGSWGDSVYHCHSRSGSGVSVTSRGKWAYQVWCCHWPIIGGVAYVASNPQLREWILVLSGQSSTWRSPPDASPSPPLAETPFFRQPDTIVPAEEEPSTSMSLRHLRGLGDMLPCKDSLKEWEPGRLDQRESNDSIVSAKSQRSYVQDLANLWVSRFRGSEQTDTSRDTGPSGLSKFDEVVFQGFSLWAYLCGRAVDWYAKPSANCACDAQELGLNSIFL